MRCLYVCLFFFYILDSCDATDYRQERAVIKYYNPKYVSQAHCLTARLGRSGIYSTNASFTNLHDWNNNVTLESAYKILKRDVDFSYKIPLCDILKVEWMTDHIKKVSDIPMKCPLRQGKHYFFNAMFPPKNFPFPLPKGDTIINLSVFITKTQENLINFSIRLRST